MTIKSLSAATLAALLAVTAPALAKGHDQSQTDTPGQNVQEETVAAAKTLGRLLGNSTTEPGANRPR